MNVERLVAAAARLASWRAFALLLAAAVYWPLTSMLPTKLDWRRKNFGQHIAREPA